MQSSNIKNVLACAFALAVFVALIVYSWSGLRELYMQNILLVRLRQNPTYLFINDFTQHYAMAKLCASPYSHEIWSVQRQDEFLNQVIQPLHTMKVFYAQAVPWFFCLVIPFTSMPLSQAFLAWAGLGVTFGSSMLYFVNRYLARSWWFVALAVALAANGSQSAWYVQLHGNFSWYLVGFACLFCYGLLRGKDVLAGIALALMAQKPQYALFLLMPALRLRRWRLIACAAAAELVLWSGAASVIGWENIWKYPSLLLSADANRNFEGIYPLEMICLRALLSAYLPHEIVMPLSVVAFFLALAAIYYAWLQLPMLNKAQVEDERVLPRWLLSLTIIAMILFSPHTHLYDQLLLFVPVALTFPPAKQTPAWPVWAFLCVAMPVESWFLYFSEGAQKFAVHHVLSMDYAMNMLVVNAFVCYRIRSGLI